MNCCYCVAENYSKAALAERWDVSKPVSTDSGRELVRPVKVSGHMHVME